MNNAAPFPRPVRRSPRAGAPGRPPCRLELVPLVVLLALAWPALAQGPSAPAGALAPAAAPAAAAAAVPANGVLADNPPPEAAAPLLRRPTAADLGVEVPRQVKAATALLGLGRQRLALVVGNGKLAGREVLDSAYRDSRAVAAALRSGGFIVMAREDLTARDLRASLLEFRSRLQPGGIGFVYIAALGAQLEGQNLLLPRELELHELLDAPSVAAQLKAGAVPLAEVVEALMSTPDSPRMLVVDAAYRHPALALLPAPGLAAQTLPPGMTALFGHALHGVQEVPAVAPLGDQPPDDPREVAASPFARVLVGAMLTSRIKPADMLRRTRSALFDASGGELAPWLGGETTNDEEFAEEPITALFPRTPEELAREAIRRGVQNLARVRGAGSSVLPPPSTAVAGAPPVGGTGLVGTGAVPGAAAAGEMSAQDTQNLVDDGVRRPLRAQGPAAAPAVPDAPPTTSLTSTLGSVAGTAASTVSAVAGTAATVATVAAGVKAAEALLVAQAAGTAATAAVGAVSTAGSLLANATALGARAGSGGGTETATRAVAMAAAPPSTAAATAAAAQANVAAATAATVATAATATTATTATTALTAAGAAAELAPSASAPPDEVTAAATASAAAPAPAPATATGAVADTAPGQVAPGSGLASSVPAADTPPAPVSSGPPVLPPPKFNPYGYGEGDTFLYQVTDLATEQVSDSFMHAVERVAADGSLRGNGDLLQLDPQGRLQSVQRPDGTQARFEPYQDLWQSAPKPGQTRAVSFKEYFQRADGSRGSIDWQGQSEVGRPQKVRTPGGEFEALPIETAGRFVETVEGAGSTNGRWRRTVWYSTQLGHPVAIDVHDIDLNGRVFRRQRIELMHAQRPSSPP